VNKILITDKKEVLSIVVGLALALSTFSLSHSPSSSSNNYFLQPAEAVLSSSSSSIQSKVPQAVLLYTGQKYTMSPYIFSNYGESIADKIRFPLLPDIAKPELILQTGKIISFEFSKTPKAIDVFAIGNKSDTATNSNSIYALKKTGVNTFELAGVSGVRNLEVRVLFSDGQYVSYNKLVDIQISNTTSSNHVTQSVDISSSSPPPSSSSSSYSSSTFPSVRSKVAVSSSSSSSSIQSKVPQAVLLYTGQKYTMSPYISSNYGETTTNKIRFPLLPDIAKPELILQTGKIISFEFSKTPKGMEAFAIDYDGDINSIYALKKTGVNTFELAGVSSVRNLEVHVLFSDGQYVSYNKLVDIRDGSSNSTAANTAGKDINADYRYSSSSSLPCSGQAKLKVAAVTASGQDTINYRATNVLDDNVDTIWSSKTKGDWIQLDLGEERSICNIGISFYRGDQSINFFSIQTSTDGAHFSPHGSGQNTGMVSSGELYGYADLPTTARFVRITNLGNMPAQEFGLAEVAVLGK
jgi:hypothetical protein